MTARDYSRFGAELYRGLGIAVEAWDCSGFLASGFTPEEPQAPVLQTGFTNSRDVCAALVGLGPGAVVVNLLPRRLATLPIFRALAKCAARDVIVRANALPLPPSSFRQRLRKVTPGKLLDFLVAKPGLWQRLCPAPGRIIYGGAATRPQAGAALRLISAHALDYDLFLRQPALKRSEPLAVFLDQCLPFHPDFAILGNRPPVSAENYYPALSRLFTELERGSGLRVVIAGHPRAPKHKNYYPGFEVVYGQSQSLVRRAALVMAHSSTAVNFAVMYRKPLLFLTSNELARSQGHIIAGLAVLLRAPCLNIDLPGQNLAAPPAMDEQAYAAYLAQYIKEPGSPDLPFWQILLNDLRAEEGHAPNV